jgi:hypothetical protein
MISQNCCIILQILEMGDAGTRDDALIQPYSGHASWQSLEVYSRLAITEAQQAYDERR